MQVIDVEGSESEKPGVNDYSNSMPQTFKEKYCEKLGVNPDDFERSLFWRAAYPHVLLIWPLIRLTVPSYFRADWELIRSVGTCECMEDVRSEVSAFHWDASNAKFFRRTLRLRISSNRILVLGRKFFRPSRKSLEEAPAS